MTIAPPADPKVIRRDGEVSPYDRTKIVTAMSKAFLAIK